MVFVYLALAIAAGLFIDRLAGYGVSIAFQYYLYKREAPRRAQAKAELEKFYAALGSGPDDDLPGGDTPLSVN